MSRTLMNAPETTRRPFVTVLALNLFGDGLREALDPRSR
jgi:hypothetical protein